MDAIFAKGSNIIATVHLHEIHARFTEVGIRLRQKGHETKSLDELLTRMHAIEQELEASADDVSDYPSLQSLNLMVSLKLMEVQQELGKVSKNVAIVPEFNTLCADLCSIRQRLAFDK